MNKYVKGFLLLNTGEEDNLKNLNMDSKPDMKNQIFICKIYDDMRDDCYKVKGFMCSPTVNSASSDLRNIVKFISELHSGREDTSEINFPVMETEFLGNIRKALLVDDSSGNDSIPSQEDILKALHQCDLKYRAIILLMSSSGMGSGDIRKLTFGDFLDAISDYTDHETFNVIEIGAMIDGYEKEDYEHVVGTWNICREKTGRSYYTFSTRQSIMAIITYLHARQLKNGTIQNRGEVLFDNFGEEISAISFTKNFQRINDTAGLGFSERQRYLTSHALRKYFASISLQNGLSEVEIDCLLGHDIKDFKSSFFQLESSTLKKGYLRVVEKLNIEDYGYDPELQEEARWIKEWDDLVEEYQIPR